MIQRDKISAPMIAGILFWLSSVSAGLLLLLGYSNSPGASGAAPRCWPAQSQIPHDANRSTLLLFVHPRCPCSRATLGELNALLAHCPGQIDAHVLFLRPEGTAEDWVKTDLWRAASAIPGVTVHCDNAGVESRRFHSETSGQTVLYGSDGRLLFEGGMTRSRGHSGDNPGRSAILALARHEAPKQKQTPVFGCALFEAECQKGKAECKR